MKNLIILSIALLSVWHSANGQATGKISLTIVDGQQQVAPNIFIELLNAKDSSVVEFGTADKNGVVEFSQLKYGKYKVFIPQTGYKSYVSSAINIANPDEQYDLTLVCKTSNQVTIVAHTPWYLGKGATSSIS